VTRLRGVLLAACVAAWTLSGAATSSASALPLSAATGPAAAANWSSGYCSSDTGVTVVADFTDLGSGIVVRCVSATPSSGVAALQSAGLAPEGTRQYGLAFICRLAGRPAADEPLAVNGHPGYTEQCDQTPPDAAHWEYWSAPNGGSWTYSSAGAASHHPIAGGFEGWSFSLNNSHHPPGATPTRPAAPTHSPAPTRPPAPTTGPTTAPATSPPPSRPTPHRPTLTSGGPGAAGASTPSAPTRSPQTSGRTSDAGRHSSSSPSLGRTPKRTQQTATAPHRLGGHRKGVARRVASHHHQGPQQAPTTITTPGAAAPTTVVSGDLPPDNSAGPPAGSAGATLAGLGMLGVLAAGAGITAWRRSRRP
jgi:hypothetical protein